MNWQPIETAPKSFWILGFFPDRTGVQVDLMLWLHGAEKWSCVTEYSPEQPSHWMALPDPPSIAP